MATTSGANERQAPRLTFGKLDDMRSRVAAASDAARKYLLSQQESEEGYWCGELEADTTLESDYILLHALLGTGNPERIAKNVIGFKSGIGFQLTAPITFFRFLL